jgi:hypothetical protein
MSNNDTTRMENVNSEVAKSHDWEKQQTIFDDLLDNRKRKSEVWICKRCSVVALGLVGGRSPGSGDDYFMVGDTCENNLVKDIIEG